jgi:hypothetical protein
MSRDQYNTPAYDSHRGCNLSSGSTQRSKEDFAEAENRLFDMLDSGRTLPTAAEKEAYQQQWNREQIANYGPILYAERSGYERWMIRQSEAKRKGFKEVPYWGKAEIEEYNQRTIEQFNKEYGNENERVD